MTIRDGHFPMIPNPNVAVALGFAAYVLAGLLFWDAYEGRKKPRPAVFKWLGGPT